MILKKSNIKRVVYSFILIIMCLSCVSRTQEKEVIVTDELVSVTIKKELRDFGKIPVGKSVNTVFQFLNNGESPLLIKDVTTSCGCTVPDWPKTPIEPNEKGEIKIVYDAKYPGQFNKKIVVFYNGKNSPQELTIKGEVVYSEEKKNNHASIR